MAPLLFGLDKFFDWLVDWRIYLAPEINDIIPGNAHQAMLAIGVVEIVAGLVVAVKPRFGGYLVAAWLAGIIIVNLLILGEYYDVALATSACWWARWPWRLATGLDRERRRSRQRRRPEPRAVEHGASRRSVLTSSPKH